MTRLGPLTAVIAGLMSFGAVADTVDTSLSEDLIPQTGLFFGANLSTLGAGLEVDWQFHDRWAVRGGINYGEFEARETVNGIRYDYDIGLLSSGAVVDFYPWVGRGWRASVGARYNGNKIDVYAEPQFEEGPLDPILGPAVPGLIEGDITVDPISPIATLGWRSNRDGNWTIAVDLGVMLQSNFEASFETSEDRAANPLVRAQLDEEERETEKDVEDRLGVMPVATLTVHYKF